ncbi:alpha-amylase family glycosyl hydrolase [Perspicuibacillus lycopersici]
MYFITTLPVFAEEEDSWEDESIYFIMVDRFNNGDPSNDFEVNVNDPSAYHGGDFQGIINKLDYIQNMGFTAIWLTPIVNNEPGGYHGYWTEDFYEVEEHFGTLEEFKQLVEEAHSRGIKVILDLVVNHTGYHHPWLNDPEKADWFHVAKPIFDYDNQEEVETGQLAGLPDLNQENPEVEDYLIKMAKWWIEETDIDGYRLDTVKHVPKWFWEDFSREVKSVKQDFFLIGEVWHNDPNYSQAYVESGIDSVVDYPMYNVLSNVFASPDQNISNLYKIWERNTTIYKNPYILGNFLDNHDNIRFAEKAEQNGQNPSTRLKQALTYMYTAPGIPIIYYGTEIAMPGGADPDNRRMMEFKDHELIDYISSLSTIRAEHPALTKGEFQLLYDGSSVMAYTRTYEDEKVLVIINDSSESQITKIATEDLGANKQLQSLLNDKTIRDKHGQYAIELDGQTAQIYLLQEHESNTVMYLIGGVVLLLVIVFGILLIRRKKVA